MKWLISEAPSGLHWPHATTCVQSGGVTSLMLGSEYYTLNFFSTLLSKLVAFWVSWPRNTAEFLSWREGLFWFGRKIKIILGWGGGPYPISFPPQVMVYKNKRWILYCSQRSPMLAAINPERKESEEEKRKMDMGCNHLNPMGRHCPWNFSACGHEVSG